MATYLDRLPIELQRMLVALSDEITLTVEWRDSIWIYFGAISIRSPELTVDFGGGSLSVSGLRLFVQAAASGATKHLWFTNTGFRVCDHTISVVTAFTLTVNLSRRLSEILLSKFSLLI